MTRLTIFDEEARPIRETNDGDDIAAELAQIGVRFERWPEADVEARIEGVKAAGYDTVDQVAVSPDSPDLATLRGRFLSEHSHAEDEVRFFETGQGLFTLHAEGRVYAVLCRAGDMISVPAGMRHWFDMGARPDFKAWRFFRTAEGWVGDFTGDPIADRFPRLEAA